MPKIGETLMGNSFKMGFGGKGANKAIACSRLGSECAVVSKVMANILNHFYLIKQSLCSKYSLIYKNISKYF